MKSCIMLLILSAILFSSMVLAQSPMVQKNVHVLQNANNEQCQAAASGRASPQDMVGYSGGGEFTGTTGPGVRSCSGCAVDLQSGDCICSICYYYFDQ